MAFRSPPPPLRVPTYKLVSYQTLAGRDGSVSRRDHNRLARNRVQPSGANSLKKETTRTPAALRERGVWGERGFSQRSRLSPQNFPHHMLFGRGPGRGKDSHSRQWRLSMAVFLNRNKRPSAAPIEVAEASCKEAASPGVLPRHSSTILGFSRLGRYMTKRRPMH